MIAPERVGLGPARELRLSWVPNFCHTPAVHLWRNQKTALLPIQMHFERNADDYSYPLFSTKTERVISKQASGDCAPRPRSGREASVERCHLERIGKRERLDAERREEREHTCPWVLVGFISFSDLDGRLDPVCWYYNSTWQRKRPAELQSRKLTDICIVLRTEKL